jgi:hypothetical protein
MIIAPDPSRAIVKENGTMQDVYRIFTSMVALLDILNGTGSPEGVVEATQRRFYMDDAGTAGAIVYIKRDADIGGDKTQGWILI